MKIKSTYRFIALVLTIITFSYPVVSFAQQNLQIIQAKIDAENDVNRLL